MHSASFVFASVLLIQAFAFPWLETKNSGAQMVSMKHGLGAMAVDKDLVRQTLDQHAQRKRELRDREAQGNKNVPRSFVGGIGSVIGGPFDIVVGDVGNIVGVVGLLPAVCRARSDSYRLRILIRHPIQLSSEVSSSSSISPLSY
jgi:hypothetical protein